MESKHYFCGEKRETKRKGQNVKDIDNLHSSIDAEKWRLQTTSILMQGRGSLLTTVKIMVVVLINTACIYQHHHHNTQTTEWLNSPKYLKMIQKLFIIHVI